VGCLVSVLQQPPWFSDPAANTGRMEVTPELPTRLRRTIGQLGRILQHARADAGLTPSQYEILGSLVGWGQPIRLGELASSEGLHPTMLSRIAGKLETAGLVTRSTDAGDGRIAYLAASSKGCELMNRIYDEGVDALNIALEALSEKERQTLLPALPVLESLVEHMRSR
jgi:DNA-binding MarR family transcriptional regulator